MWYCNVQNYHSHFSPPYTASVINFLLITFLLRSLSQNDNVNAIKYIRHVTQNLPTKIQQINSHLHQRFTSRFHPLYVANQRHVAWIILTNVTFCMQLKDKFVYLLIVWRNLFSKNIQLFTYKYLFSWKLFGLI